LPQLAKAHPTHGYMAFHNLSQHYGDIMSLRIGMQEMVVLSSYEVMKDLLHKEELSGRLWVGFLKDRSMGKELGLAFTSGPHQTIMKKYTIRALREFGFGKQASMTSVVETELEEVMRRLKMASEDKSKGGVVRMERFFQLSSLNVLWTMMAGIRYSHDDPKLQELLRVNSGWLQTGNFFAGIVAAFPFIRHVFPEWTGYNFMNKANQMIYDYVWDMIGERKKNPDYATNPQTFIDVFLGEIDRNVDESSCFTADHFMMLCYDMFQAGFETTSNTTAFGLLFMVLNQGVQRKVQQELDAQIGRSRFPLLEDSPRIPYTKAALYEVFRMSNALPLAGARKAMVDFHWQGHTIPAGTGLVFNTYSVMRSKKLWGDPHNFRPERFLDSDGTLNGMEKYIGILFGHGQRSCLGEPLAQTTVFMYFTALIQNFSFEPVPGESLPTTDPIFGIILSPQPYNMIVKSRT